MGHGSLPQTACAATLVHQIPARAEDVDSSTHVVYCHDFGIAYEALTLLVRHGYRELKSDLERFQPCTVRLVSGRKFGRPYGSFVLVWQEGGDEIGWRQMPSALCA
jgi:hypothetical protein